MEKKSSIELWDIPSTSKCLSPIKEYHLSNNKFDFDQKCSDSSIYFESKTEREKLNGDSPEYHPSDNSIGSLSENSLDFSSEESLSEDNTFLGLINYFLVSTYS